MTELNTYREHNWGLVHVFKLIPLLVFVSWEFTIQ